MAAYGELGGLWRVDTHYLCPFSCLCSCFPFTFTGLVFFLSGLLLARPMCLSFPLLSLGVPMVYLCVGGACGAGAFAFIFCGHLVHSFFHFFLLHVIWELLNGWGCLCLFICMFRASALRGTWLIWDWADGGDGVGLLEARCGFISRTGMGLHQCMIGVV